MDVRAVVVIADSDTIARRRPWPVGLRTKSLPPGFRHVVAQKRIEHQQSASRSAPVVSHHN
jgi:hypothetical protein